MTQPTTSRSKDPFAAANRARWDELVAPHLTASGYTVDALRAGDRRLHPIEESVIGDVAGLSVLHLQCHFGLDTLTLAQRGARVTGIDFSPKAITAARSLAEEVGLTATFVEGDLYDAPSLIDGRFDLVFTTWGTICWLPDLAGWAEVAAGFLKPGGRFYFADCHPVAYVWADEAGACDPPAGLFRTKYPYFHGSGPLDLDDPIDYASDFKPVNTRSFEWVHTVGDIVTAVSAAGLTFEFLREHPEITWALLPSLVATEGGQYGWPEGTEPTLPLSLSFMARKSKEAYSE